MITSELLKEAIADAKAVRATALANAKAALEEAFTPKLQSMLAEKLKEEVQEESVEKIEEKSSTIGAGDNKVAEFNTMRPVTAGADKVEKQKFDAHMEESKETGYESGSEKSGVKGVGGKDGADYKKAPKATDHMKEGIEDIENVEGGEGQPEGDEDISFDDKELEEILNELENEAGEGEEPAPAPVGDVPPPAPAPIDAAPAPVPVVCPPAPAPVAPEASAPAPAPDDEEINLEALLEALEEESEEEEGKMEEGKLPAGLAKWQKEHGKGEKKDDDDDKKEKVDESQIQAIITENEEFRKTVEFLREELNDVNLLNAKLLYTNKLFKSHGLNNPQKMKIIEAFDLTNSIREVKLTYAAMTEALNLGKEGTPKRISITEGLASKPVATTRPANKVVPTEVNEMASRFQTLAGIKGKK